MGTVEADVMPRRETMLVRIDPDVVAEAKIAASQKGQSLSEYATAVLREAAARDIERFAKERLKRAKKPKPQGGEE